MKIKINKTTEKEIKRFIKREWRSMDIEHYGRRVNWQEKNIVFKATENKKIIGIILAKYEAGVIYLRNIIVDKNKRSQGIGKMLMEKVERVGKRLGAHKIFLYTGTGWASEKFYRSLGYRKTADLPKHYFKRHFALYSKFI